MFNKVLCITRACPNRRHSAYLYHNIWENLIHGKSRQIEKALNYNILQTNEGEK